MIRVLHIVGGMDRAGAETMIMNLYRNIDRSKVQFDFLYFTDKKCDFDDEIEELGGKIYRISKRNPLVRFFKFFKFLKLNKYKIIHSHTLLNSGFNVFAAYLARTPKRIVHSHSTKRDKKGFINSIYVRFSKFLISNFSTSFIACGKLAGNYLFGNKNNFIIINNSVDVSELSSIGNLNKNYWHTTFRVRENVLKLLQVGRLHEVKNHEFSLKICKELKNKGVNFIFFIVGQGELEPTIAKTISNLGLDEHVRLLGLRTDIAQLMAGADIHLLPSKFEGFPVTLVESQAVGLKSFVSNTISKEVDIGVGLVDFIDVNKGLGVWVDRILNNKKESLDPDKKNKILVKKGFDSVDNAKRLQSLYLSMFN